MFFKSDILVKSLKNGFEIMTTTQEKISKIKNLLGTESGSSWINFMDYISVELSEVLKRGKPTALAIENSIIGIAGFKSWREMVDTDENKGGLGWNHSSFDAWKRAYSVVLEHPYLRVLELTASQINTINRETKNTGVDDSASFPTSTNTGGFPSSLEAFKSHSEQRLDKQRDLHQNSLKDAQNRVVELERENLTQFLKLDKLHKLAAQNEGLTGELAVLNQKIGAMQNQIDDREEEVIKLGKEKKLSTIERKLLIRKYCKDMSFGQKVLFVIFNR